MRTFFAALCVSHAIFAASPQALFQTIPHKEIPQLLAYSQLYPDSEQSRLALEEAWQTLYNQSNVSPDQMAEINAAAPDLIQLLSSLPNHNLNVPESTLELIEKAAATLGNRNLKGFRVESLSTVAELAPKEIDLARALLLSEIGSSQESLKAIRQYEAALDLMALYIQANVPNTSAKAKIDKINEFLFQKLRYRFPSHKKYAQHIDNFTLLTKVIDARQGVCLGVTMLYLSLAQRLNLPLEIATPPGHIYIRHQKRNIETTAGGIHLEDDVYKGIEMRTIPTRNLKEVIGLAHINSGSTLWHQGSYDKALAEYANAKIYMGEDPLLNALTGFCHLLNGSQEEGERLLKTVVNIRNPAFSSPRLLAEDLLEGRGNPKYVNLLFEEVDSTRAKLEEYRQKLEKAVEECPRFRSALMQLATTWLKLEKEDRALQVLEQYHAQNPNDPTAEYLLAELALSRQDYPKAWNYLKQVETLLRDANPQAIKRLRFELKKVYAG